MRFPFDAKGTIGSLPCEVSLNKILAERADPGEIHKITKLLQQTKAHLKSLLQVKNKQHRQHFALLLRRSVERTLADFSGVQVRGKPVNNPMVSHTMCCIAAYFRKFYAGDYDALGRPAGMERGEDELRAADGETLPGGE
jgi:hypothetical protein